MVKILKYFAGVATWGPSGASYRETNFGNKLNFAIFIKIYVQFLRKKDGEDLKILLQLHSLQLLAETFKQWGKKSLVQPIF